MALEKLLTPSGILVIFTILLLKQNLPFLSSRLVGFGIPEYTLLKDYVAFFFSWPFVVLLLGLTFILRFSDSIKKFLENSNFIKAGPVELGQRQQLPSSKDIEEKATESLEQKGVNLTPEQLQAIEAAFNDKDSQLANKDQAIKYLLERSELFEFAYLNLILVFNTKTALLWFYFQPSNSSTKENFMNSYSLSTQISDSLVEKEAIFNALLVNQLVETDGGLFKVSEKGKRFLRFQGHNIV